MLDNARVFIFLQDIVTSTISLCLPLDQRIMYVSMAKSHGLYLQALTCFHVSMTHSLAQYEYPFYTRKNVMRSGDVCAKYCLTTIEIYLTHYSMQMFILCIAA